MRLLTDYFRDALERYDPSEEVLSRLWFRILAALKKQEEKEKYNQKLEIDKTESEVESS